MSLHGMNGRYPRVSVTSSFQLPSPASSSTDSSQFPPLRRASATRRSSTRRTSTAMVELATFRPDILEKLAYRPRSRRPAVVRLLHLATGGRRRTTRSSPSTPRQQQHQRLHRTHLASRSAPAPAQAPRVFSPCIKVTPPTPDIMSPISPVSPEDQVYEVHANVPVELPAVSPLVELPDSAPTPPVFLAVPTLPSELPASLPAVELYEELGAARGSWQSESEQAALRQAQVYKQHSIILEEHLVTVWVRAEKAEKALEATLGQSSEIECLKAQLASERAAHAAAQQTANDHISALNCSLDMLKVSTSELQSTTQRLQVRSRQLMSQNQRLREEASSARAIFSPASAAVAATVRPQSSSTARRTLFSPGERSRQPHGPHQQPVRRPLPVSAVLSTSASIPESLNRFEWNSLPSLELQDPRRGGR